MEKAVHFFVVSQRTQIFLCRMLLYLKNKYLAPSKLQHFFVANFCYKILLQKFAAKIHSFLDLTSNNPEV